MELKLVADLYEIGVMGKYIWLAGQCLHLYKSLGSTDLYNWSTTNTLAANV